MNKSLMRIALVGDCNVGKTTIIRRFMQNRVQENTVMTIGVDKHEKIHRFGGETFHLTILDMSGCYQFQSVIGGYLNCVDAVIFVFDVTDKESFVTLPYWSAVFENNSNCRQRNVSKILVGNKKDLPTSWREVLSKTARNYANFEEMVYLEVSAKTEENVELLFHSIMNEIITKRSTVNGKLKELQKPACTEKKTRRSLLPFIRNLKSFFGRSWSL